MNNLNQIAKEHFCIPNDIDIQDANIVEHYSLGVTGFTNGYSGLTDCYFDRHFIVKE